MPPWRRGGWEVDKTKPKGKREGKKGGAWGELGSSGRGEASSKKSRRRTSAFLQSISQQQPYMRVGAQPKGSPTEI